MFHVTDPIEQVSIPTYFADTPPDVEAERDAEDSGSLADLWELMGRDPYAELAASDFLKSERGYSFYLVPPAVPPAPTGAGAWVAVAGGDLPCMLRVRLARSRSGRVKVTGLVVGDDGAHEVTSDTLRAIRLADITQALLERFRAGVPPFPDDAASAAKGGVSARVAAFRDARSTYEAYWLFKELIDDALPESPDAVSENAALRDFAEVYRRNLREQPRRAMTATAAELHISRATANRRADEARRRGLLPPKGDDTTKGTK